MNDIPSPFNDLPRVESPGEKVERWAGNLSILARRIGLDVTDGECHFVAQVIVGLGTSLSEQQALAIANELVKLLAK